LATCNCAQIAILQNGGHEAYEQYQELESRRTLHMLAARGDYFDGTASSYYQGLASVSCEHDKKLPPAVVAREMFVRSQQYERDDNWLNRSICYFALVSRQLKFRRRDKDARLLFWCHVFLSNGFCIDDCNIFLMG